MPFGEHPPGILSRRRRRAPSNAPLVLQALGICGALAGGIAYLAHDAMARESNDTEAAPQLAVQASAASSPSDECGAWAIEQIDVQVPTTKDGRTAWDVDVDSAAPDLRLSLAIGSMRVESATFNDSVQASWKTDALVAKPGTSIELMVSDVDGPTEEPVTSWRTELPQARNTTHWQVGAAAFALRCTG